MRSKRAALVISICASAMSFHSIALAQDRSGVLETRHRVYESPQNFAIEFRLSPYTPDIDKDPALGGKTPYNDTFGTTPRILISGEFDWQAVRVPYLGTFGPGVGIGYTSMSAKAPLATPRPNGVATSDENTNLSMFPMYAVAVLRADVIERNLHIPLVPYIKAGVAAAFWRAYNDGGTSSYNNVSGKGHSFGTMYGLGLAFDLNPLDEYSARNFDNAMGVNHTYLFAEYYSLNLSGLGLQSSPLRVGATTWAFGLTFEF